MRDIIFLIIPILLLVIISRIKIKHTFWDKQPVMRTYSNDTGIINYNANFDIKITEKDMKIIINDTNFDVIWQFLNDEFSDHLHINKEFFRYQYDISGALNISLYQNNEIVGFIHSHPITIILNGKTIVFEYVDFLCIKRRLRNVDLATILICSILNETKDRKQPFLFKRDSSRLPFLPILESKYYYKIINYNSENKNNNSKNISNRFIKKLDIDSKIDTDKYLNYYNELVSQFRFHKMFTNEEFDEMFIKRKILKMYIISQSDTEYETLVVGKENKIDWLNRELRTFDIDTIVGDMTNAKLQWKTLVSELESDGYNFITIPYIGTNINFILDNYLESANNYQYYYYNYKGEKLNNYDVCFNIN